MIEITAIHLEGGNRHEHISSFRWKNGGGTSTSTRDDLIAFLDAGGRAFVSQKNGLTYAAVVNGKPRHIRTVRNGKWSDELLNLPPF